MNPFVRTPTVSRRALLGGAVALSTAALTGCGGRSGAPAPGPGSPRRGGRLRAAFAGGGANETLDPHLANLFNEASRAKAVFDKLADYGGDVSIVPRLASGWEPNADLTRWRVTLREATFHDGSPVRARDVLYSYARIADPKRAFRARASLALIDLPASRAVTDRQVEFALVRPYAEFPNLLATFGAYVVPEGSENFDRPIGSGPFRFDSFQPGRSLLLSRYDDHWDGTPYLDELEYLTANEESARINALLGGQVEYAHDVTPTTARTYERDDRVRVTRMPNSTMQGFTMKVDRPPFDNRDLREAMFLLTDRQQLVDTVLSGAGQIGNDLYGKGYQYYADDIPQRTPDLDRARFLIDRAGARGLTVKLDTAAVASGFVEAASTFAEQASTVGLTVVPTTGNKDTYWKDILDGGVLACYRSGAMPIETHISQRLLTNSTTNATGWARPDFDARYVRAISSADEGTRRQAYGQMQRMLHAEGGFLIWGFADFLVASAPRVGGVAADAPANTLDWARFDKVWLG
ncbi:peptide ABC transporter substrate-binding protein [Micromonospora rosaria]|uniref:Peptide ABC transporter substrate-binding protein n=1 Tax=Micromonospora rosaria TaxID=47874 RepID=A0A136PLX8_9ACTN|nr:ABC transporter substrate-binding protein [Micromonospora rosaria]KXK59391.1 peptide ABC transporter substrate-binding protein [Micromonospora rosaria]